MSPGGRAALAGGAWRAGWLVARLVAGSVAAARLARAARSRPPLQLDPSPLAEGSVTVVVPARDEAQRIGPLLDALAREPTLHRLVVVDDESSDATATVALAAGAQVVRGGSVPAGWIGKPWALQQGLAAARTAWVVTLDADTVPGPGLLAALVRRCQTDGWDFLSVGARFRCDGRLQQLVHASMLTTLVYRFGPPGRGALLRRPARWPTASAPCSDARPSWRRAASPGRPPTSPTTSRCWPATSRRSAGASASSTAPGPSRCGCTTASPRTWRDWGRSLPMPDVTSPGRQVADLGVVLLAQALPLARLVTGRADRLDIVLLLLRVGTLLGTRHAYRRPGPGFWLSPLADLPVAARLVQGAVRPERTWRGRHYRRTPS